MDTKSEILKNLGYSDELIAMLNLTEDFVCHDQHVDYDLASAQTQDFAELIIENVQSGVTSNF